MDRGRYLIAALASASALFGVDLIVFVVIGPEPPRAVAVLAFFWYVLLAFILADYGLRRAAGVLGVLLLGFTPCAYYILFSVADYIAFRTPWVKERVYGDLQPIPISHYAGLVILVFLACCIALVLGFALRRTMPNQQEPS